MSNPVSMALGPFGFEAIGFHFDALSRSVNTNWAEIEVAQRLNAQQWTGPSSDEITIRGVLFPVEHGGQDSLDGVIAAAQAGEPQMFVSGDAAEGRIYGYHTIQGVEEDRGFLLGDGRARKNAYQIKLKRYDGEVAGSGGIAGLISLLG